MVGSLSRTFFKILLVWWVGVEPTSSRQRLSLWCLRFYLGRPYLGLSSRLFCTLSISHLVGFVKRFFTFFLPNLASGGRRQWNTIVDGNHALVALFSVLLLTPLLYHTCGGLSRGFSNFFQSVLCGIWTPRLGTQPSTSLAFPLDTYYYSRLFAKCKMEYCTNEEYYFCTIWLLVTMHKFRDFIRFIFVQFAYWLFLRFVV